MLARIYLHIRTFASGRAIVTPVRFADLEADAPTVAEARRIVVERLTDKLRKVSVDDRTSLLQPCSAELTRVEVGVLLSKRTGERLPLPVGVVVLSYDRGGPGSTHVALPPSAPWFRAEGGDRAEVLARVTEKLDKALAKWALERALMVEEPETARLESVELPLPLDPERAGASESGPGFLAEVGRELTAGAAGAPGAAGAASPAVDHREPIVARVLAALAQPDRSSVMLVGPRDVGKTAIVHEVAKRLAAGEVPAELSGREVWEVTANELIAGAQYTGQWQERGRRLIEQARARRAILAMGDPAGILDAGRWAESDNNLSRLLRPHMERGGLTLICECTAEALGAARLVEPSFVDAFHRVDVPEPPLEETRDIVAAAAGHFDAAHGVGADDSALAATVELTRRFEPYRGFPGKAVRLLEEASRTALASGGARVTRADVVRTFTGRTGLPLDLLLDEVPLSARTVAEHFEARVLGQPEAVRAMVDLVMVLKAALNDPGKPLGTFLFVGPTGVGKTELARALAELLFGSRDRVLRLDMGEYTGSDAVQRLVGTRWGREDQGELTRQVREQPFCVVLLDEVEKAHWQVFDALLAALGEGRLTDAAGRTADLRSAIIVMTSNLGAEGQRSGTLGFASSAEAAEAAEAARRSAAHYLRHAEEFFRPEFFNRIDRVLVFDPLDEEAIRRIARRELGRLLMREGIVRRQLLVEVEEAAVRELAARGFHPRYGARPLQREIERAVVGPLARRLVEQRPAPGDLVRVRLRDGEVVVDVQPVTVPAPAPARAAPAARPDGTLGRAAEDALALSRLLEREESAPAVAALRDELSRLVSDTQRPAFWDEPLAARETLARVYGLQRLLDSLAGLRSRAQGLAELGRQLRQSRDRSRLPTLRQAMDEIEGALELLRLELAGAARPGPASEAVVRVTPVGQWADGWARDVLAMYVAWAGRTGREVEEVDAGRAVTIAGPSSRDLLESEGGLHRRVPAEGRPIHARVTVAAPGRDDGAGAEPVVVRIYDDRRRHVRDPRTGVHVRDPAAVLRDGRIDPFLVAGIELREQADRQPGARPVAPG